MDKCDYDVIVVGAGLYGSVVAWRAKSMGLRCLVIERRNAVGGNIRDVDVDGINVHLYGAHIFHTDDDRVWQFVRRFAGFDDYTHTVLARNGRRCFHMPINLVTFREIYGDVSPKDVDAILSEERSREFYEQPANLEQKAVNLVGRTIYNLLIKGYTEKQWGCSAECLPASIIERLPVRYNADCRYFSDLYQGIPSRGYRGLVNNLLSGVETITGVDFCKQRDEWMARARRIVYTGMVDELLGYRFGELRYRGLDFHTERIDVADFQGTAVVNETSDAVPYTRTIEHKHFGRQKNQSFTIVTREYPSDWCRGKEAYYPVNDETNNLLYRKYRDALAQLYPSITLGGRLGEYRYYDMDDAIRAALDVEL